MVRRSQRETEYWGEKKRRKKEKYIAVVDEAALLSKGHVREALVAAGTRKALRVKQEAVAEGHSVGLDRTQETLRFEQTTE